MSFSKSLKCGLWSGAAALSLCVACGGSSSGGSGPGSTEFSSSLPGDKSLGSLSDSESAKLCSELESYYGPNGAVGKETKEVGCRFSALFLAAFSGATTDSALQAACKSGYDQCQAAPAQTDTTTCMKPAASCTATVAEMETCISDSTKALADLGSQFPECSKVTLASLQSTMDPGTTPPASTDPPSCTAIEAKCPGFLTTPTPSPDGT